MSEEPLVSVILVNWNGLKWLKRCLDSLISQTYPEVEIIIVDNNSDDQSVGFLKTDYPQIAIVQSENNRGFAGGNSLGIAKARGSLILLLNNDTWVENTFIEDMIKTFQNSSCDILGPYETEYHYPRYRKYKTTIDMLGHPFYSDDTSKVPGPFYLSGVCLLFEKKVYEETKGLDENFFMYFEEIDWFWRLHLLNKKIEQANFFVYHAGAGSTGSGIKYKSFLWRNQNTLQMLLKNYELKNLCWIIPLYLAQNIVEIIFFLITFNPKIAYTYIQGWLFNLKYFKVIMLERAWVQENRKIGDREIIRLMYIGSAKIRHLINFLKTQGT